jgi:mRNA interferase RelE/StbE
MGRMSHPVVATNRHRVETRLFIREPDPRILNRLALVVHSRSSIFNGLFTGLTSESKCWIGSRSSASTIAAEKPPWRVVARPAVDKALRKLSRNDRGHLLSALRRIPEGDIRRLTGAERLWRLRVGEWRAIFERDDGARIITVLD